MDISSAQAASKAAVHLERLRNAVEAQAINELAFNAYLAVFGLAVLFVLIALAWPKDRVLTLRGWRRRADVPVGGKWRVARMPLGATGIAVLFILCAVSRQLTIDETRGFISDQPKKMRKELREAESRGEQAKEDVIRTHYLYLPQEGALRYMSLGNLSVAADYMWLTSLQYVSSPFRQGNKFELLHRFYRTILDLDPHWVQAQVNAGKVLSALEPNRFLTDRFLRRAMLLNPEDYRIPLEAGHLWVVPPGNPDMAKVYARNAAQYFSLALSPKKKLPRRMRPHYMDLIGRLNSEAGQHRAAAESLLQVAGDKDAPERMRTLSSRQWLLPDSLQRVGILQSVVTGARRLTGKWPPSIPEAIQIVVQAGRLKHPKWLANAMPGDTALDAYGRPIVYDPVTGRVASRGVQCMRAIQKVSALQSLVRMFKRRANRHPMDMRELTAFTRRLYAPPNDPPFAVLDALGVELDCEANPLGEPWSYDPDTGEFRMPDDCQARVLYRNERAAMDGWRPSFFGRTTAPQ